MAVIARSAPQPLSVVPPQLRSARQVVRDGAAARTWICAATQASRAFDVYQKGMCGDGGGKDR